MNTSPCPTQSVYTHSTPQCFPPPSGSKDPELLGAQLVLYICRWRSNETRQITTSLQLTFGILAPRLWYCWGFFKKLTNSRISTLASSQPATSAKRTPVLSFTILAFDWLMLKGLPGPLPPPPPNSAPRRVANITNASSAKEGRTLNRILLRKRRRNNGVNCSESSQHRLL